MKFNYKLASILICLQVVSFFGIAQSNNRYLLAEADSLFAAKKYTESFELYDSLLTDYKVSSSAMLLKMAFIKEGLNDYSNAEYYLNLYYLKTSDRQALTKMTELAEANQLVGYEYNDSVFAETLFLRYFDYLTYLLLALAILLLSLSFYQKFKRNSSPMVPGIFMVLILAALFYTLNFGRNYDRAIIGENNTYLMTGPSAGAEVLQIVGKGHRVKIKNAKDVWTKIEWNEAEAYIKTDKLKTISFL